MGTLRFDRVTLDRTTARRHADGSLVVRGRFARTGLQTYHNEDGSERVEYRSPAVVRDSAATFEGSTITDQHPAGMVRAESWNTVARGHVQGISYVDEGPDGEGWLEGSFHVKDASLATAIERGDRQELSAGYFCDAHDGPGEYKGQPYHCEQAGIVGNHVAALPFGTARAGRGARLILDSNGNQLPPEGEGSTQENRMSENEIAEAVRLARSDADSAKARADALEAEVATLKAKLAEATDPARIDALARARADLVETVRRLAGPEIDTSGSDHEIRVRALDAIGVKLSDGQKASEAYVNARVDAALDYIGDSDGATVADAIDPTPRAAKASDPIAELFAKHAAYIDSLHGEEN
jgi:hypothetical protein